MILHRWLHLPVRLLRLLLDLLSNLIFPLFYERGRRSHAIPPISDVLLLDSASVLAEKIRTRQVKSADVVRVYFKRIEEVNDTLNCYVHTRFAAALDAAEAVDTMIAETNPDPAVLAQTKPFLGVPFSTKDCFAVEGFSWTVGLVSRKGQKARHDADCVKAMKEAGAIAIGVTNVAELCLWFESANNVYGRSSNPYHTGRTVGGSSGGEACAIAAAASVVGIGSDVGGSIRIPAFFCGIFGHKPSSGVVSNKGQLPVAEGNINRMLSTGPMCRYAADLMPMFKVLAGKQAAEDLNLNPPVNARDLKVFYMEDDGGSPLISPVDRDLKMAQKSLIKSLDKNLGIKAKKVDFREFFYSLDIWTDKIIYWEKSAPSCCEEMTDRTGKANPFLELFKWFCYRSSHHTLPVIAVGIIEKLIAENPELSAKCDALKMKLEELLGDDGVLLYPTHSTAAPYHGQPLVKGFNFAYTAIFNAMGNPVTQCPLGLGRWGVPLGIQIVGAKNQDRNTLALAKEVERLFGGWVPPTGVV